MIKKLLIPIVIVLIIIIILVVGSLFGLTNWLFSEQYNSNGVSHFLVITIDKNQKKEYIGELDDHKIYIEGLNIEETNFRNVDAENVSIKEALDKALTSINEWKKYAFRLIENGEEEIYRFDNYEIGCTFDTCTIRPIKRIN